MIDKHEPHRFSLTLAVQGEEGQEIPVQAELSPDWTAKVWVSEMWKDRPETILQLAEQWLDLVREPGSWEADLQILEPRIGKNEPTSLLQFELNSAVPGRPASKGLLDQESFLGLTRLAISRGVLKGKTTPTLTLQQVSGQTFHKPPLLDAAFLLSQAADELAQAQGHSLDRRSLARFAINAAQVQLLLQRALMGHKDPLSRWMRQLSQQSELNPTAQRLRAARAILGERRDDVDYALALSLVLLGPGGLNQALHQLDAQLRAA
jgi:hypothetical protein